jgi:succinate dehydrogenase / fumarate reductase cytochrome b subunit
MLVSARSAYVLKRLHSLTGVVPVGLFLLEHLFTNSMALHGPRAFNEAGRLLAGLPYVQLLELFGIALPLLFHMVLGVIIVTTGQASFGRYRYPSNGSYVLQRVSGLILVLYIVWHVWTTRLSPRVVAGDDDLFTLMEQQLANPWIFAFYVLGVLSAAWHFANGLFGFSIHWGLATGRPAQRAVARLGYVLFLVLSLVGINSLLAFRHHPVRIFERVAGSTLVSDPAAPESDPPAGAR